MPGLTGTRGTTYNLPNYHGELFALTPADTPFLSSIGGLTGGKRSTGTIETEWQAYDLREAQDRQRLEGADAPDADTRVRLNLGNVLEIHQETVDVSYTKQAAINQFAGANIAGSNPVLDEFTWQVTQTLLSKTLDVEHSFLNGKYNKPGDNTGKRRTRGLIQAIELGVDSTSNAIDKATVTLETVAVTVANSRFTKASHGLANGDQVVVRGGEAGGFSDREIYYVVGQASGYFSVAATSGGSAIVPTADVGSVTVQQTTPVDSEDVIDLLQKVWENGGIRASETATLIAGAAQKRMLTNEFITKAGYSEQTRNVGGVSMSTFETDFGRLNIMLSRIVPKSALVVCSLEQCTPVLLEIPGKGVFFVEPLGKKGASDQSQLYGEIGLEYGNPLAHGLMKNVAVA